MPPLDPRRTALRVACGLAQHRLRRLSERLDAIARDAGPTHSRDVALFTREMQLRAEAFSELLERRLQALAAQCQVSTPKIRPLDDGRPVRRREAR